MRTSKQDPGGATRVTWKHLYDVKALHPLKVLTVSFAEEKAVEEDQAVTTQTRSQGASLMPQCSE